MREADGGAKLAQAQDAAHHAAEQRRCGGSRSVVHGLVLVVRCSRLVFCDKLGGIVLFERGGGNQVLLRARVVAGNFSLQLGNDILAASRLCLPGGNNEASSFGGVEVARR